MSQNKIKPEKADGQCGFVQGKGQQVQVSPFEQSLNELWKYKKMYICASLTTLRHFKECDIMR